MSILGIENLKKILKYDEGVRLEPYLDSLGNLTVGVGHLLAGKEEAQTLTMARVEEILEQDIQEAYRAAKKVVGPIVDRVDEVRQNAIISLAFNLGPDKLSKFKRSIGAIHSKNWEFAATCLGLSKWHKQVKSRSGRICQMIRHGRYPKEYGI